MTSPKLENSPAVARQTLKYSDLVYDVGLHRGEDTDFYLKKGFRVVAFEANPDLVNECRLRFQEFIDQGRLTIVQGAIVEPAVLQSGQARIRFYRNETGSAWGTIRSEWAERNEKLGTSMGMIEVDVIDFEATLAAHGIPHYMKIDIEGCDDICLKSLEAFRERPDYISIESNKTSFSGIRDEVDLLASLGYDGFQAVEQTGIPDTQVPPQPPREGGYAAHRFAPGSSGLFGAELGGQWRSRGAVLRRYLPIYLGYRLLGDFGTLYSWQFRGAARVRRAVKSLLERVNQASVPGWYDTHARLASNRKKPLSPGNQP